MATGPLIFAEIVPEKWNIGPTSSALLATNEVDDFLVSIRGIGGPGDQQGNVQSKVIQYGTAVLSWNSTPRPWITPDIWSQWKSR